MSTVVEESTQAASNFTALQSAAAQDDFLLFCPSASDEAEVMNAIHALYYLPSQYKLVVMKSAALIDGRKMAEGNEHLIDRILFETETRAPGETPSFSYADAVISNAADSTCINVAAPQIVISQGSAGIGTNGNGVTVPADSPEALASAAMLIAKRQLAAVL